MEETIQQEETDPRFFPMLAFEGASASSDLRSAWATFRILSDETKGILISNAMPVKIRLLADTFSVSDGNIVKVSAAVRELFFAKYSLDGCAAIIAELVTEHRDWIVPFLKEEILTVQPDKEEVVSDAASAPTVEHLALLPALGKYARLGEQQITRERIRVANQPELVRPSLTNWLKCYREELGIGYHDPMLRAKFLFQSVNGKALSSDDRERVNLLLRSMEENAPLDIDTAKMEIVFPSFDVKEGVAPVATHPSSSHSSPSQTRELPSEREAGNANAGNAVIPHLMQDPGDSEIPRQATVAREATWQARNDNDSVVPVPAAPRPMPVAPAMQAAPAPFAVPKPIPVAAPFAVSSRPVPVSAPVAKPVGTIGKDDADLSRTREGMRKLEAEREAAHREMSEVAAANEALSGQMEELRRRMDEQAEMLRSLSSKAPVASDHEARPFAAAPAFIAAGPQQSAATAPVAPAVPVRPVAPSLVQAVPIPQKETVSPARESESGNPGILKQVQDDKNRGAQDDTIAGVRGDMNQGAQSAANFLPPMAPKRDPGVIPKSMFTIRPTENAFEENRSADALGSFSFDDDTAAEGPSGLRMAKGMQFTSLEKKDVPKADANTANLSFTSSHTLSVEKEGSGGFAIARSAEKPLPTSRKYADERTKSATAPTPSPLSPANAGNSATKPAVTAAPKVNPFHITPRHNVSDEEQAVLAGIAGTGSGSGRIVNLRDEG